MALPIELALLLYCSYKYLVTEQALEFRWLFLTREVQALNTVTEQSAWRRHFVVFPSSFTKILG